eukprot:129965_1
MSHMSQHLPSTNLNISPIQIDDILFYIFRFTNPLELSSSISLVCPYWNKLVFNNKILWLYYCDLLWKGKFFITAKAMNIKQTAPIDAFKLSYLDRQRNVITINELTSIQWHFKPKTNKSIDENNIIIAKFNTNHTLTHQNNNNSNQQYIWKFVQEITNTFGLQRSSRFHSLNDFDINTKNSTNSNPQTCYGYITMEHNYKNKNILINGKKLTQSRWIKINNFQPLCAFREEYGWGWILQNEDVIFTSY